LSNEKKPFPILQKHKIKNYVWYIQNVIGKKYFTLLCLSVTNTTLDLLKYNLHQLKQILNTSTENSNDYIHNLYAATYPRVLLLYATLIFSASAAAA
jgi:hypothetical protein